MTKKHDDVPVVKSVNELEDGLRTYVTKGNEYLSKVAKEDDDYY